MKKFLPAFILVFSASFVNAQVDGIKSSSSNNSSGGEKRGAGGRGGEFAFFFVDLFINNIVPLQQQTLQKKTEIPELVSLELRLQTGLQPSAYFLALPRIRANWGLFSTDYRRSYLIESNPLGSTKDISWNDWQLVQLNIVNTPNARFRIGGGIMSEAFEARQTFTEYTAALAVTTKNRAYNGELEFRQASDLATGATPRWELNAQVNKKLFDRNRLHAYLTGGGVFQQYYGKINVWAFTAGLNLRLY